MPSPSPQGRVHGVFRNKVSGENSSFIAEMRTNTRFRAFFDKTVGRMDAAAERTGMYSQRVLSENALSLVKPQHQKKPRRVLGTYSHEISTDMI